MIKIQNCHRIFNQLLIKAGCVMEISVFSTLENSTLVFKNLDHVP